MHERLQEVWYGGAPPAWWLRVLASVYGLLMRVRQLCYAQGWQRPVSIGVPVIVVGNVTVGGTGKTPLVLWLAAALGELGLRVAVVTRGYGRREAGGRGAVLRVAGDSSAGEVGDEALLISRRAQVPVLVARDRVAAARAAVAGGANVVISDDGLQHLRLGRDVEIALIDAARGLGNGLLLPAGPLRESAARLGSVSAVVLTGEGAYQRHGALRMRLLGEQLLPASGAGPGQPLAALAGRRVHALAGIGNPGRFFAALQAAGLEVLAHPLPDHHPITPAELDFGDDLPLLMTEKDAVKCAAFAPANCWYLPVTAGFEPAAAHALLWRILMDARLLDILACPVCKGPLRRARSSTPEELVCRADRLAFPVRDGIPVMLEEEARVLAAGDPLLER
jgi:tetraacyldisaccharide 4'-kinase